MRLGELLVETGMATCRACRKMVSPEWKFCPCCRQDFLKPVSGRSFA